MDFNLLKKEPRLLIEADLEPLQGTRFQATGFPDLGAATYQLPGDRTPMLLLESAQSLANRLESTIWDEVTQDVVQPLKGIPYVVVKQGEKVLTNSLLEAHRLSSFYILEGKDRSFPEKLSQELDAQKESPVDFQKLARVVAKYDINSLLHGIFIAKKEIAGGRFKLSRALAGFIEARNAIIVSSGGVKNDRVNPSSDPKKGGGAKKGGGNIPFHREEFTSESIKAYFSLDLTQINGYRLNSEVEDLLIAISLYKILKFLDRGLRLRTACDLDCRKITIKRPTTFELPKIEDITKALPDFVIKAKSAFANPSITTVNYEA